MPELQQDRTSGAQLAVPSHAGYPVGPAYRSITDVSGMLDRPLEPVIRPAKGRTGWPTITAGGY